MSRFFSTTGEVKIYWLFLDYIIYLNPVIELQRCNNAKYRVNVKQFTLISGGGGGRGGAVIRPLDKLGGRSPKNFFSALRASL